MEADQMKLDPVVLERIMFMIESYTSKQKDVLANLTSNMHKLSDEWDDPKTFGEMFAHLEAIDKKSIEMFEQMRVVYKKFYFEEIRDIKKNLAALKV